MNIGGDCNFLAPWQSVLVCRLKLEPLQEPLSCSQAQHLGWLTIDLPSPVYGNAPSSWFVEWAARLREALELFALAAPSNSSVWEQLLGVQGFPEEELCVRYRLVVGDRFEEVRELLTLSTETKSSSASFEQAKLRITNSLKKTGRSPATVRVPISLVVKPEQWTDCLLRDIDAVCATVNNNVARPDARPDKVVEYAIAEVQLDLQEDFVPASSLSNWLQFLSSGLPVTTLSLAIARDWTAQNVQVLVDAADQGGVGSITLTASSSDQVDALIYATSQATHVNTVVIDAIGNIQLDDGSHNGRNKTSSVQSLHWLLATSLHSVPPGVESLKLRGSTSNLFSTLGACGRQLKSLCFSGGASISIGDNLCVILSLCPNLKHLEFDGVTIRSLDGLTTRYKSSGCQLQSLALRDVEIADLGSVDRLAVSLAEANSTISQRLVEFAWLPRSAFVRPETIEAFHHVLKCNPRLRYLSLRSREPSADETRVACHHLRRLPGYRLAFVSVMPSLANNALTRDVVEQILAFADIGERRRVVFRS